MGPMGLPLIKGAFKRFYEELYSSESNRVTGALEKFLSNIPLPHLRPDYLEMKEASISEQDVWRCSSLGQE